jgi:thiol-disulfide isomerase/thioredoxin
MAILAIVCCGNIRASEASLDLGQFRGSVVILDFWASWCVPCRRSFPWLNTINGKYSGDGLVVIGVNLDNEEALATAFLDEYPASFRIYFDRDKSLARQFEVAAMPSSFLIGPDGRVLAHHQGFRVADQDDYEAAITTALQQLE